MSTVSVLLLSAATAILAVPEKHSQTQLPRLLCSASEEAVQWVSSSVCVDLPTLPSDRVSTLLRRLLFIPEPSKPSTDMGKGDNGPYRFNVDASVQPRRYLHEYEVADVAALRCLHRLTWMVCCRPLTRTVQCAALIAAEALPMPSPTGDLRCVVGIDGLCNRIESAYSCMNACCANVHQRHDTR
jgi:hypothetical protein